MLTPQAIKDQEFQIKFRGYDNIEVKSFLELLAEDFFVLAEENRELVMEAESLKFELSEARARGESLERNLEEKRSIVEGAQHERDERVLNRDGQIVELQNQLKAAGAENAALTENVLAYQNLVNELEERLAEADRGTAHLGSEVERLNGRIEILEEQNRDLKQEGSEFRNTILAAQKFADSIRMEAELEAEKLLEDARKEVQLVREEAEVEIARLPLEIKVLEERKAQVRKDLQAVLTRYLDELDLFPENIVLDDLE
ncbi:MAG: hypothetical protein CSA81_13975 [Acidobacteria bacterium]|nr:MAG: hypothetical protein CSA81_13975 [Acidobacteriota bacterium]